MKKRILALVMSVCMLISALPVTVLAADHVHDATCGYAEAAPCAHTHDGECGYIAAVEGAACTHSCTDGSCAYQAAIEGAACTHEHYGCGYEAAVPATPCAHDCNAEGTSCTENNCVHDFTYHDGDCGYFEGSEESPCEHSHNTDCGYVAPVAEVACDHEHDDVCGYAEAAEAQPCTHTHDDICGYSAGADCTYVAEPTQDGDHTHEWHSSWTANETNHWHACTGSGTCDADDTTAERAYGAHDWDSTYTYRCNTCYYRTEHTCTGGEATCKYQATCDLCGVYYGETNPDNHQSRVADRIDEASHKVYCAGCDHVYVESESHTFGDWEDNGDGTQSRACSACRYYETEDIPHVCTYGEWISNGNGTHTHTCTEDTSHTETADCSDGSDSDELCDDCSYDLHEHNYSAATCSTPATCSCGATTGGVDSTNHTGGTEVRGQKDATEFEEGYTGDTYCLDCDTKLATGEVIGATHTHSYSAVDYNGDNHWDVCSCGDKKDEAAHEWTYTYDDDIWHTMACTVCAYEAGGSHGIIKTMVDDNHHWWNLSCCGNEKNKGSHTYDNAYATQCNATFDIIRCTYDRSQSCTHSWGNYSNKDDVHEKTCSKCGLIVREDHTANTYKWIDGKEIAAAHTEVCVCGKSWDVAHTWTQASTHSSYCTECGYWLDNHTYTAFKPSEANPETYHVLHCSVCGEMSDPVQVAGHNYEVKKDKDGHWNLCTDCGYTTAKTAHQMTVSQWEGTSLVHINTCSVCQHEVTENCDFKQGTYAGNEDGHWAVCFACGRTHSGIPLQAHVDENSDGTCDVCKEKYTPPHTHNYKDKYDSTGHYTECDCGEKTEVQAHSYTGMFDSTCDCGYDRGLFKVGTVDTDYVDVGFIPGDGVTLPDDAELVVEEHYPSLAPIASTIVPTAETEYVDIPENNISRLEGIVDRSKLGEIIVINGEKYMVCIDADEFRYLIRLSDKAKFIYTVQKSTLAPSSMPYDVEIQTNRTIVINGAKYDVFATIAHNGIEQYAVLYVDGVLAGLYIPSKNEASFCEGYDPETLKAQQDDNDLGSVTIPADYNNAAIADLAPGKTYKVSVIGSNDISVEGLTEVNGTVSQTFKIPDALVGAKNVKYVAVHDTNPYAAQLAEAKQAMDSAFNEWAVNDSESAFAEYERLMYVLGDIESAYDAWEAENGSGAEFGTVTVSDDGKIVTVTYAAVDSFSPFIVYAFVEADEPEYKTFVTQEDGTLALVTDDQPVTHTVAQGENLTDIARRYGCTVDEIVALNVGLIEDPSLIRTGWVLTVPVK